MNVPFLFVLTVAALVAFAFRAGGGIGASSDFSIPIRKCGDQGGRDMTSFTRIRDKFSYPFEDIRQDAVANGRIKRKRGHFKCRA
jgi:hypothetical protein